MGCKCNCEQEDLEIEKSEDGEMFENQLKNNIKSNYLKSSELLSRSRTNNNDKSNLENLTTITENNETINRLADKSQESYKIQEDEKEDEDNFEKIKPLDEFSQILLDQINELREKPYSFIDLIHNSEVNIQTDRYQRLIYKSNIKVALNSGLSAFEEAKLFLSNTKPMEKLIYDHKMTIKVPKNEKDIKDRNYLKNQILKKRENGINIKSYWKEIINDPETCFLLMIVDDNWKRPGSKRRDILNPEFKHIGISSYRTKKSFACYITLK